MIYRTMVFGHRKCSGGYKVHIRSPEGVPGTPGKRYGPYGPRGETHQPQGAGEPPIWAGHGGEGKGKEERKKGIGFPLPPLPFLLRIGIGKGEANLGGAQVGFLLLGAPPWLPLLPSNLYICGRGTTRTHINSC